MTTNKDGPWPGQEIERITLARNKSCMGKEIAKAYSQKWIIQRKKKYLFDWEKNDKKYTSTD